VLTELKAALASANARLASSGRDPALASRLEALAANLGSGGGDATAQKRVKALRATLQGIAKRLR
jgi:hypothetical protein